MPASTRTRSTVKNEKLAQRLSDILARLHQGEALDKHQLVAQYQVQVRTIERDLGERLCGIAVRCEDGLWRLTQAARGTIPAHYLSEYQRLLVVRYWLPHVRIVQPQAWHEELVAGLRRALAQWDVADVPLMPTARR
jgi:hypothetical protein